MLKISFCAGLLAFLAPSANADQTLRALSTCGNLSGLSTIQAIDSLEFRANNLQKLVSPRIKEIAALDPAMKPNQCQDAETFVERYENFAQQIADANPKAAEAAKALGEDKCAQELTGDGRDIQTSATNLRNNFTQAGCPPPKTGGMGVR